MATSALSTDAPPGARLVHIGSGEARIDLGEVTRIGRDPDSDVPVADPMVSPRHAEIRRTPEGTYRLVDLASRRGTFVSGKRVTQDLVLATGDEILIGVSRWRFEGPPGSATRAQPAWPGGLVQRRLSLASRANFRPAIDIEGQDELRSSHEKLRAAFEVTRTIGVEHEPAVLLERILDAAFQLFTAERGAALLLDSSGRAVTQTARLRSGERVEVAISTSILSEVVSGKAGVIIADAGLDSRFERSESICTQRIRSAMCVPMMFGDELLGILHLDSQGAANAFTDSDLELFQVISTQAALALKNAMLARRVETVVDDERRRLERVLNSLPSGVVLLDADHRVVVSNARADEMLPLLGPARRGDVLEGLGTVEVDGLLADKVTSHEVILTGPPRRVLLLSALDASPDGAGGSETIVVLDDVTEQREAEARSSQQERLALIGQLAGGVAHDFNNLLAVILNYADFVRSEVANSAVAEDVEEIRGAALRAVELTRQLLAFSRREVVKPKVFELDQLVTDMAKLMRRTLGENVPMTMQFAADLPRVKADPSKIEQVMLNLVVNARDAMPEGGRLRIETAKVDLDAVAALREGLTPGRYAVVTVHDTGVGMAPEVVARVFEPFFTTKERGRGTGLGLAMVYGIVKQAGGNVTVRSEPGAGTTFRIALPATEESLPEMPGSSRLAAAGGSETILLAEDEPAVRAAARRILVHSGYTVIEARNGDDALRLSDAHPGKIDVLVTDLVMPGMSGKQLADRMHERRRGIEVVFMSGYVDEGIARHGVLEKDVRFLPKPFTRIELLARVTEALLSVRSRAAAG